MLAFAGLHLNQFGAVWAHPPPRRVFNTSSNPTNKYDDERHDAASDQEAEEPVDGVNLEECEHEENSLLERRRDSRWVAAPPRPS